MPFDHLSVDALFVLAGGVVLLIFIGIRNAWDIVTFIATGGHRPNAELDLQMLIYAKPK